MNKSNYLLSLIVFFLQILNCKGQENSENLIFELNEANKGYGDCFVSPKYIYIFEDTSFTETEKLIPSKVFKPLLGVNHDSYKNNNWIKFSVKNNTSKNASWTLVHADPHAFHFKLFEFINSTSEFIILNEAGTGIEFDKRVKPFHSFSIDLEFKPNETKTFYAYYKKGAYYNFKYFFQTQKFALEWELTEYAYLGVFYGLIIFALINSLISFITLKQKLYLIYVIYLLATIFYIGHHNLLTFQFLWPNYPIINTLAQHSKGLLLLTSFYLYVNYYFKSSTQVSLYYDFYIKLSIGAYSIITIIDSFFIKNNLVFVGIAIPYILLYLSVFKSYKIGFGSAKRFLIGFTALLIGFLIYFLMELNYITANVFTVYSLYFAIALEITLFTSALSIRYKFLEKEKNEEVFKFTNQIQKIKLENSKNENEFTLKFENNYTELLKGYEKAKLDLLLAENEIRQFSSTEGKSILEGNSEDQIFMGRIIELIERNITNPNLDRELICLELGLSKSVLYRKLKDYQGVSINSLIRTVKLRKALSLLKTNSYSVSDVANETGFNSLSYFTKAFKSEFGCNPSDISS